MKGIMGLWLYIYIVLDGIEMYRPLRQWFQKEPKHLELFLYIILPKTLDVYRELCVEV